MRLRTASAAGTMFRLSRSVLCLTVAASLGLGARVTVAAGPSPTERPASEPAPTDDKPTDDKPTDDKPTDDKPTVASESPGADPAAEAKPEAEAKTEAEAKPEAGAADVPTETPAEEQPAAQSEPTTEPEPDEMPKLGDSAEDEEPAANEETGDEDAEDGEEQADPLPSGVPEKLPPLQQAGWWTVFGAFVLGTTAGVFAGLAERQEDKATRLASRFDLDSGAQLLYEDEQDEYERLLRRGEAFQNTAIALAAISGAVLIGAAALFIVDRRRSRKGSSSKAKRSRDVRLGAGGVEVRF